MLISVKIDTLSSHRPHMRVEAIQDGIPMELAHRSLDLSIVSSGCDV